MSTVVGIRLPDGEKWEKMMKVWDVCRRANVKIPQEVLDFFGPEGPKPEGIIIPLGDAVKHWADTATGQEGFNVAISDLPADVSTLRFYLPSC